MRTVLVIPKSAAPPPRAPLPGLAAVVAVGLLFGLGRCGGFADQSAGGGEPNGPADAGADTAGPGAGADTTTNLDAGDDFVPETENDLRLQPPAASRTFVFVANTDLNSVARIDSLTLSITTIEVGLEPTVVRTVPTGDRAVVLDHGSNDVAVIFADQGDRVETVPVTAGANSLVLSPTGEFAIAYYDDAAAKPGDHAGSLSDVTRIDLRDGRDLAASNLVVGLHIRQIEFAQTGQRAFFVTDDGVSVVDLPSADHDAFVPPVAVSLDPLEDAQAVDREVAITADGRYALVRTSTETTLRLVDLVTGVIRQLDLGAVPTDLDLLPSGDQAVVVLRDSSRLAVVPLPVAFLAPIQLRWIDLGSEVVGLAQLIPGPGTRLALFSTVGENDHLSILDLDSGTLDTYALRKGIEAVYPAPDGSRLVVMHTKLPGDPVPGTESFLAQSYGFSIFNLDTRSSRLVLTEARPGDFVFGEDGESAFIILADADRGVNAVEWVNLGSGRDQTIELRRLPQAIGVIPATGRVFVSESHEVGRMAFIDPSTGEVREVTGYQLNSRTE